MSTFYIPTQFQPLKINARTDSPTDEAIIKEIFAENVYRLHDNFFADSGVVLDIGANIGIFTLDVLLRAKSSGLTVVIYAFEPEPHNLELLKQNLEDNKWLLEESKVFIIEKGIAAQSGKAFISNEHGSSRVSDTKWAEEEVAEVTLTTLDEFIEDQALGAVDFAKFDIEGSEVPSILATSDETLDKIRRTAIEFDDHNGLDKFSELVNRFARNCSINTLGVPAKGCYIYTERFDD